MGKLRTKFNMHKNTEPVRLDMVDIVID